jgi:hypothetical protein
VAARRWNGVTTTTAPVGRAQQFLCSREGWTRARTAGRECGGDVCTLLYEGRGAGRGDAPTHGDRGRARLWLRACGAETAGGWGGRRQVGPTRQRQRGREAQQRPPGRAGSGRPSKREGKKARARAGSVRNGSRPTGPLGPEGGRGSKNRSFPFSFSELIFKAHFQMIFKSFQLKNKNHSSQKKCSSMSASRSC